ncbi:hypothetical protein BRADI_1g72300v3 [Brachypodium distachyon]|uniref:Uncharacterized protein n=1 Tax=Brachypodium distachyon TaxID=15368 RepID=I1H8W8_BRADI|nr:hypothetical protein BRADI_1g72300v3 [Brachypodium distachyon]
MARSLRDWWTRRSQVFARGVGTSAVRYPRSRVHTICCVLHTPYSSQITMDPRENQEWTSYEVEEARSIIARLNSNNCSYHGNNHDKNKKHNIMLELQAKFPWKTIKQNFGVPEEQEVSMDHKDFSFGFTSGHVGIMETMKEVPMLGENKMPIHQPVVAPCARRFWTTDEHRLFLQGLNACGRGKWRNISMNFVTTKTPAQIASHAQKYFKRIEGKGSGTQRYSIHDVELGNNDPWKTEDSSRPTKRSCMSMPTSSFLQVPSTSFVTMDNMAQFKFPSLKKTTQLVQSEKHMMDSVADPWRS